MKNLFACVKESFIRKRNRKKYRDSFKVQYIISDFYADNYDSPSDIDLITIAFNAPRLISYQIRLMKKFLKGNFRIIICDNSTDQNNSKEIKNICQKENITYIRVKDRSTPNGYSNSHAIALNWTWKNVVKQRKNNFAFLDHDIFPVKEIDISNYVRVNPVYGRYYDSPPEIWYLWPGFSFFNWDYVKDMPLNFHRYRTLGLFKRKNVDTGSANWNCLYKNIDRNKLAKCSDKLVKVNNSVTVDSLGNNDWYHILDGANRYNENADKIMTVLNYLDNL